MLNLRGVAALATAGIMAAAPTAALAASYVVLTIDRKAMVMTDLRSPRLTKGMAQIFEVVILRTPTKVAGVPAGKTADYQIVQTNVDCAKNKLQQQYSAAYNPAGVFQSSDLKARPWTAVKPNSPNAALKALGCAGANPQAVVSLGDVRVGKVMADYRAGLYDRYIR